MESSSSFNQINCPENLSQLLSPLLSSLQNMNYTGKVTQQEIVETHNKFTLFKCFLDSMPISKVK